MDARSDGDRHLALLRKTIGHDFPAAAPVESRVKRQMDLMICQMQGEIAELQAEVALLKKRLNDD